MRRWKKNFPPAPWRSWISMSGRWRDVEKGAGKLVDFVRPKDL